jgi:hypothetical protein
MGHVQSSGLTAKKKNRKCKQPLQKLGILARMWVMVYSVLLLSLGILAAVWEAIWNYHVELNICLPSISTDP